MSNKLMGHQIMVNNKPLSDTLNDLEQRISFIDGTNINDNILTKEDLNKINNQMKYIIMMYEEIRQMLIDFDKKYSIIEESNNVDS